MRQTLSVDGVLRAARSVVGWMVALALVALVAVAVLVPRLVGGEPYVVLTRSMSPAMPAGTLVVVRPVEPDGIAVGDVITYQLVSGQPQVVTHRVVARGIAPDGQPIFRTRGDANEAADVAWVHPAQIKGARWYAVPHLGRVTNLLNASQREVATTVFGALLLAYAAAMFVGAWRGRRVRPGGPGFEAVADG